MLNLDTFIKGLTYPLKKARKSAWFEKLIAKILPFFMRFSYNTTKWVVEGADIPESYHESGKPFIGCLWHDRLMLAPCFWKWSEPLHVLASSHRDGQLIAKIVESFSMPVIYGSTGKNGVAAVKNLIKLVKQGKYIAVIPDGPRGPRHKLAPGVIAISRLTNIDIIVFSFVVKKYHRLKSWDKFMIVWPFNRGAVVWGKPIKPEELRGMSTEEAAEYVGSRINEASQKAHKLLEEAENNPKKFLKNAND